MEGEGNYASTAFSDTRDQETNQGLTLPPKIQSNDPWLFDATGSGSLNDEELEALLGPVDWDQEQDKQRENASKEDASRGDNVVVGLSRADVDSPEPPNKRRRVSVELELEPAQDTESSRLTDSVRKEPSKPIENTEQVGNSSIICNSAKQSKQASSLIATFESSPSTSPEHTHQTSTVNTSDPSPNAAPGNQDEELRLKDRRRHRGEKQVRFHPTSLNLAKPRKKSSKKDLKSGWACKLSFPTPRRKIPPSNQVSVCARTNCWDYANSVQPSALLSQGLGQPKTGTRRPLGGALQPHEASTYGGYPIPAGSQPFLQPAYGETQYGASPVEPAPVAPAQNCEGVAPNQSQQFHDQVHYTSPYQQLRTLNYMSGSATQPIEIEDGETNNPTSNENVVGGNASDIDDGSLFGDDGQCEPGDALDLDRELEMELEKELERELETELSPTVGVQSTRTSTPQTQYTAHTPTTSTTGASSTISSTPPRQWSPDTPRASTERDLSEIQRRVWGRFVSKVDAVNIAFERGLSGFNNSQSAPPECSEAARNESDQSFEEEDHGDRSGGPTLSDLRSLLPLSLAISIAQPVNQGSVLNTILHSYNSAPPDHVVPEQLTKLFDSLANKLNDDKDFRQSTFTYLTSKLASCAGDLIPSSDWKSSKSHLTSSSLKRATADSAREAYTKFPSQLVDETIFSQGLEGITDIEELRKIAIDKEKAKFAQSSLFAHVTKQMEAKCTMAKVGDYEAEIKRLKLALIKEKEETAYWKRAATCVPGLGPHGAPRRWHRDEDYWRRDEDD
jgi:hypothetical protein